MRRGLLIVFKSAEQPAKLRDWLGEHGGLEFSPGVWLLKSAAPPAFALRKIVMRLSSPNEGVAVIRIMQHASHQCSHNFPALADWFKPERERDP